MTRVSENIVNHPFHYNTGTLEVIDAIDGLGLGFYEGNVLKYIARYKHKGGVEDLRKAAWYLNRLITLETARVANNIHAEAVSTHVADVIKQGLARDGRRNRSLKRSENQGG